MALNLVECLELTVDQFPDRVAIHYEGMTWTYAEVAGISRRIAQGLRNRGIGYGDTVAMLVPNTPQFPMIFFGILYTGATVVSLNSLLRAPEMVYQLKDSGAKAFFVWSDMAEEAAKAFRQLPQCEHLFVIEPGFTPKTPLVGESFLDLVTSAAPECDTFQTRPDDTAVILYTSAMDGFPKGVELTHFNLFQNSLIIKDYVFSYTPEDVCLGVLPLFHTFGLTSQLTTVFLAGASVILLPRFEPARAMDLIEKHRVTLLPMVPTMLHLMVHTHREPVPNLSSLRAAISGGAPLDLHLARRFEERFEIPVLEGYGLTETSPVVAFNRSVEENRPGSMGKPIWGTRVRIRREDGSFAEPWEIGEIVVRGPNVMKGYHNQPEATRAALRDGWLHTGDYGYVDEDGYVYFAGLKKRMILRAAMNVYPAEVERVLQKHPGVEAALVVGIPDEMRGQEVKAYIVPKNGVVVTEKDLHAFARENMAAYKCPKRYEIVSELPSPDSIEQGMHPPRDGTLPADIQARYR
jgi:long-chain acyl-CoA synthetase